MWCHSPAVCHVSCRSQARTDTRDAVPTAGRCADAVLYHVVLDGVTVAILTCAVYRYVYTSFNWQSVDRAVPKTILALMNVEGLTRENVASHLQKYRAYLKRLAGLPPSTPLPSTALPVLQQVGLDRTSRVL